MWQWRRFGTTNSNRWKSTRRRRQRESPSTSCIDTGACTPHLASKPCPATDDHVTASASFKHSLHRRPFHCTQRVDENQYLRGLRLSNGCGHCGVGITPRLCDSHADRQMSGLKNDDRLLWVEAGSRHAIMSALGPTAVFDADCLSVSNRRIAAVARAEMNRRYRPTPAAADF